MEVSDTQEIKIIETRLSWLDHFATYYSRLEEASLRVRVLSVFFVAILLVAIGGWRVASSEATPTEFAIPLVSAATTSATSTTTVTKILVHVTGEVQGAGVLEIEDGSRVIDAIRLAGGPTSEADLSLINLAEVLSDGSKIFVPGSQGYEASSAATVSPPTTSRSVVKVDPNSASAAELESLPGIGPALAQRIIEHRKVNGPFSRLEDLLDVSGIGVAKLEAITESVRL